MRYDDERYFSSEESDDLWDDELEINDSTSSPRDYSTDETFAPTSYYDSDYSDGSGKNHEDEPDPKPAYQNNQEDEADDFYSDQEPENKSKPKREGFFRRKVENDDEEDNDYFDSDEEPAPVVKKPKHLKLDPEDPDYWIEEEESAISSIIPPTDNRWKWWLGIALGCVVVILFSWIWFFRPYSDNAVKYGYLKNMERRGSLIKTFEGSMIPYKELGDPDPLYFQEVRFSVASDSLAAVMKRMMLGCVPIRVEYELYHAPLPWKGEEKMIIIKADTADPRKILPPEYQ